MRSLWLAAVVALVGCTDLGAGPGRSPGNGGFVDDENPGNSQDDWATNDDGYVSYFARFGGSIDMGDDEDVNSDGLDEGSGEEYAVISTSEGDVECDWRWTTDSIDSPQLGDCVNCDIAWDVTCYDGHEERGNCDGWIDPTVSSGPVQFYLAFEPSTVEGDLEHGTVYVRHSLYDEWAPYAPGTRTGNLVEYEFEYELY